MSTEWKPLVDDLYFNKGTPLNVIAASLEALFPDLTKKQLYEKVRKYVRRKEAAGKQETPKSRTWRRDPKTGVEDWGGIIEFPAGVELTPNDVMAAWKLKPSEWECLSFDFNIYQMNAGEGKKMNLYQCKIKVKPITVKNFSVEAAIEAIQAAEVKRAPKRSRLQKEGMLAALEVVDIHYNKLGSEFEAGSAYNPDTAESRFWNVIHDFEQEVYDCAFEIEKIYFPVGGDFFNSDNMEGTTTGGTPQNNALRPQEAFKQGYELIRGGVLTLSTIAPVEVILCPGNHDALSSFYMAFALEQYFREDDNVEVDYQPTVRKYRKFGVTGLCFAHGDKDRKRLLRCVLSEARETLGSTKYFEVHAQHLHEEGVDASTGITIRSLPSIVGTDAWHHQSGYVGARVCAQSFLYDKECGLKHIIYHPG